MKKFPKPWFRSTRGLWYVTLDGTQHNLGPDRDAAFEAYKKLLAEPKKRDIPSDAVVSLIDEYLEWCRKHRRPETYRWYLDRLQEFAKSIDPDLKINDLRPFHVQKWVDAQKGWANGTRRNAIAAVTTTARFREDDETLTWFMNVSPCSCKRAAGEAYASRMCRATIRRRSQNPMDVT